MNSPVLAPGGRGPRLGTMTPAARAPRDRYVDLLRATSICMVVFGHWMVSAITLTDSELGYANLLDVQPATHPLTWVFQVMPVFFLVGGYANAASLASPRRGTTAAWIRRRALRLLRPSILLIGTVLVARLVAVPLGLDADLVRTATWAMVTPLWFLVVYLAVALLAPLAEAAHRRWGLGAVVALVVAVAIGDAARLVTGDVAPATGNYLFGWLAVHQLGFAWRDGLLPATPARQWAFVAAGLGTALLLVGPGPYGVAMVGAATPPGLTNTAPPTLALLALAMAQLGAVLLLRGPGTAWVSRPGVWTGVVRINLRILTVFLWHMAALVIGGLVLVGWGLLPAPETGTAAWFALRLPWLAVNGLLLAGLVALLGRFETGPRADPADRPSPWAVGLGLVAVLAGLAALGVTDTVGMGPQVGGVPVVEVSLVAVGLVILERAGHPARVH